MTQGRSTWREAVTTEVLLHLLVERSMLPVPPGIVLVGDYGCLDVIEHQHQGITHGEHMCIRGSKDLILKWLTPFESVWIGQGTPQFQKFNRLHISEHL